MMQPRPGRLASAVDWAFRDRRTGAITIAQAPNAPLWLFAALSALAWAAEAAGPARLPAQLPTWLHAGAALALAWWALDEILRGVNPWRRVLGAAVLVGYAALILRHADG